MLMINAEISSWKTYCSSVLERKMEMHYSTLVHLPFSILSGKEIEPDSYQPQSQEKLVQKIDKMLHRTVCNTLDAHIWRAVSEALEPFFCETTNWEFLEFEDHTEEILENYETETCNCFRLPQGKIVLADSWTLRDKFTIRNGKACSARAGSLHHTMRTKKSRKLEVLLDYPLKKLYKTLQEYAEAEGYRYYRETGKVGEFYNPNSFWDWFAIGGGWPQMFLVKADCPYKIYGDTDLNLLDNENTPDGYIWVCGARKCDIEWKVMNEVVFKEAERKFQTCQKAFETKTIPEGMHAYLKEDGLYLYTSKIYASTDTLDSFLLARGLDRGRKVNLRVNTIFYEKSYEILENYEVTEQYRKVEEYINSLPEDEFIIGVDCHM